MIVVSDTSPLTYLHQIERFELLRTLYEEIIIPPLSNGSSRKGLTPTRDWVGRFYGL